MILSMKPSLRVPLAERKEDDRSPRGAGRQKARVEEASRNSRVVFFLNRRFGPMAELQGDDESDGRI
jgi:hypothetical protein